MQDVSKAYKESMKKPMRNRGYIRATIGVINSAAQASVEADEKNKLTYFSNKRKPFENYTVDNIYATSENNFTRVGENFYFLPYENSEMQLYNNGLVTEDLIGSIYISFGGKVGFDIKGLTIDFGDCYPTKFTIQNDNVLYSYENNSRHFSTENVFNETSYFIITPSEMVNIHGRLRIYQFFCGIINSFTNKNVLNYSSKEYVSSITDTIPSNDVSLEVDNQNLYYSPDNPDSTLAYFEIGQEMKIQFGYDVLGDGNIEWLPETTAYLNKWSADDVRAKFNATDRFNYLSEIYLRGLYRENGISLYDLAIDVLNDAGITDEREYFLDPYLKNVVVYNPMPAVKHSEALQIIANAGRCAMYEDRESRIHIQASFIPDMVASTNNQTKYSHVENVLNDEEKDAYAESSFNFSIIGDEKLYFISNDVEKCLNTGYVSESVSDSEGNFTKIPKIIIELEAAFIAYGVLIRFRNVAPQEFRVTTYYQDVPVGYLFVENSELEWLTYRTYEQFKLFDKMIIEFTKGSPNSRVFVDNIILGDVTDYTIRRNDIFSSPTAVRQDKIKSISVIRNLYQKSTENDKKDLQTETLVLSEDTEYIVTFNNSSYDLDARIILPTDEEGNEIPVRYTVEILESSNYYAKLKFSGFSQKTTFEYAISGYEYVIAENSYTVNHNLSGSVKTWNNPLISTIEHAKDLEEWLASYFLGDVDYQISWRGDPRTDANDLFYLELKDRPKTMIRAYQNELSFNGAWNGKISARKVVL